MDFFKFNPATSSPTHLINGNFINGIDSATWIERYRENGEFTFVSKVSSGLQETLPRGSFISHMDTYEVMMVENHEIEEGRESEPTVKITGRSLESFLENRVIGANQVWPLTSTTPPAEYVLDEDYTWIQAQKMIKDHIEPGFALNASDHIPGVRTRYDIEYMTNRIEAQTKYPRNNLYSKVLEHLAIEDLGIKTVRPGPGNPLGASDPNTTFLIHDGKDKSKTVLFSYDSGEIETADYLWSNKKNKTAALVTGKWMEVMVQAGYSGYDKKVIYVDGTDIDDIFDVHPATLGGAYSQYVTSLMQNRGLQAIMSHNDVIILKPELPKLLPRYSYRKDYNIGDIISVAGNYGVEQKMRVVAYVEIEDENGETGYPTLSVF